jgi:hypothetical protein
MISKLVMELNETLIVKKNILSEEAICMTYGTFKTLRHGTDIEQTFIGPTVCFSIHINLHVSDRHPTIAVGCIF